MNVKKYFHKPHILTIIAFAVCFLLFVFVAVYSEITLHQNTVTYDALDMLLVCLLISSILIAILTSMFCFWLARTSLRCFGLFCEKIRLGESRFPSSLLVMWISLHFIAALFFLSAQFPHYTQYTYHMKLEVYTEKFLSPTIISLKALAERSGLSIPEVEINTILESYTVFALYLCLFLVFTFAITGVKKGMHLRKKLTYVKTVKQNELYQKQKQAEWELYQKQQQAEWETKIAQRDALLGFHYEDSAFFQQLKTSYFILQHDNGSAGEFETYRQLRSLESEGYHFIFNREIPKRDGLFTEADIIIVHSRAIFVVENKDYSGVIYGKATEDTWTYIDHSGKKISFYSPIKQNEGHIRALREYLTDQNLCQNVTDIPICSLIIFTDTQSAFSDDIISRIDTTGTNALICTSQNAKRQILNFAASRTDTINSTNISQALLSLSIRQKNFVQNNWF